jgi:8-oxo-dGTP pyrophosphatase MutT (NUDIX family)
VSFPGGKRDPSDTSNIVVALREAQEETALNPFDVKLLGDLPIQRARSGLSVNRL